MLPFFFVACVTLRESAISTQGILSIALGCNTTHRLLVCPAEARCRKHGSTSRPSERAYRATHAMLRALSQMIEYRVLPEIVAGGRGDSVEAFAVSSPPFVERHLCFVHSFVAAQLPFLNICAQLMVMVPSCANSLRGIRIIRTARQYSQEAEG